MPIAAFAAYAAAAVAFRQLLMFSAMLAAAARALRAHYVAAASLSFFAVVFRCLFLAPCCLTRCHAPYAYGGAAACCACLMPPCRHDAGAPPLFAVFCC